jgi:ribosomal protein S18 acetylase RimI-like enzyme
MESTMTLQFLTPTDWRVLRDARLQALRDSPHAFTSSYANESRWDEREWRRAFSGATWVIAREAESAIGLARSVGEPWMRHLESIWVAPTYRRRGVLRALLRALAEVECVMGVTDLLLWVVEDNYAAQRAYEALGFEPTGERQPLSDFGRFERRLRLVLDHLQDSKSIGRRLSAKLGQRPALELQEIHGFASATHIVDAV